jgi:hypothetical protein
MGKRQKDRTAILKGGTSMIETAIRRPRPATMPQARILLQPVLLNMLPHDEDAKRL